jgi:hypothetical protein
VHVARILEVPLLDQDVLGQVDVDRPGRPVAGDVERLLDDRAARSLPSLTRKLCLVAERVMPTLSASWKASLPIRCVGTCR